MRWFTHLVANLVGWELLHARFPDPYPARTELLRGPPFPPAPPPAPGMGGGENEGDER